MKPAVFFEAHTGNLIEINPNFVIAKMERRKNGETTVFIHTTVPDTCFEVRGTLSEVNAKFADK